MENNKYDIVLFGATSFVGKLTAAYLLEKYGYNNDLKWAIAGRDAKKLENLLFTLGCAELPIIIADSFDEESLLNMAAQTKVICTTVGPYSLYGSLLVKACISSGTNYCDLTGETAWMRLMIDEHHEIAKEKKIKIVHNCGFDSIPSDLGVFILQHEINKRWGMYATKIKNYVTSLKGSLSGGTYLSMRNQLDLSKTDPAFAKMMGNTYLLNPDPNYDGPITPNIQKMNFDTQIQSWIVPFIMGGINMRVVRRSHALLGYPYGETFIYQEVMATGGGLKGRIAGLKMMLTLGLLVLGKPNGIVNKLIGLIMPKPGEGPSAAAIKNGYYQFELYGTTTDGHNMQLILKGEGDPGYGSTSKMLAESAVCIAKDEKETPDRFGVLTPSIALGSALLNRLKENAGLSFQISEKQIGVR